MEKYGTPQIKEEVDGMVKVSEKKLNECCKVESNLFVGLDGPSSLVCKKCGNKIENV